MNGLGNGPGLLHLWDMCVAYVGASRDLRNATI